MKRLLLRVSLFFIPILILAVVFEYYLGRIPNTYNVKRHNLENQLDSIEVLVLGSSQAVFGINPTYFSQKGYNVSNTSQSLFYDKELILKYIDKTPNLKYVLITFSYFSLGSQVIDGIEPWRDFYYYQFWDVKYSGVSRWEFKLYSKTFLYTPKNALLYASKRFKVDLSTNLARNGYQFRDTVANYSEISDSLGRERVNIHNRYYFEKDVEENKATLEQIVAAIKERGVTPIIVTPPVYKTYAAYCDKARLNSNTRFINSLCKKYGCQYFNYFEDTRFTIRDFSDNDHLNFVGAEKFSKILDAEAIQGSHGTTEK